MYRVWQTFQNTVEISYVFQHLSIVLPTLIVGLSAKSRRDYVLRGSILFIISMVVLMMCSSALLTYAHMWFEPLWAAAQIVYAALIMLTCNDFRARTRVTMFFTHITCLIATMQLIGDASFTLATYTSTPALHWGVRTFSSLLCIPCGVLIRRWNIDRFERVKTSTLLLSGVIAVIVLLLQEWVFFYYTGTGMDLRRSADLTLLLLLVFASLLVINMIYCYALYRTCALQTQVADLQADVLDRKRVEELISLSEKNVQKMREVRHDIKNQFAYLRALADKGNLQEVQTYLHEISYDFLKPLKAIDCGNANMNAILNMELSKAERLGLLLDMQVIVPQVLPFQWSDLCSLVTNLIDNALEGCVCGKGEEGVKVRIIMQGEELFISVTNPTDKLPEFLAEMRTTKENQEAHGFGTKIIHRIVEKYNGYYTYDIADGRFCVNCMLNS